MNAVDITIRPYIESDETGVVGLWREAFPDTPAHNVPEEDIRRKLAIQRELFYVVLDGDRLVGSAMAGFDGHRGWVYYVAVAISHRRNGIGEALMSEVEQGLKQVGCSKLNLQVRADNHEVVAFYKKLGYEIEERVSMGKKLV
jgi:ribosomal protein S18 acetylase RimI-like enzyme